MRKERSLQEWNDHKIKVNECATFFYKYVDTSSTQNSNSISNYKFKFLPILCKSNSCPNCSRIHSQDTMKKLHAISKKFNLRFFTLTTINTYDTKRDLLHIEKCWRKLIKELSKRNPQIKFFRIIELGTQKGMVHIHGLWNIYIDFIELSTTLEKNFRRISC